MGRYWGCKMSEVKSEKWVKNVEMTFNLLHHISICKESLGMQNRRGSFCSRFAAKRAKSDRTLLEILNIIDKRLLLLKRSKLLTVLQWQMNGEKNPMLQDILLTLFRLCGIQENYFLFSMLTDCQKLINLTRRQMTPKSTRTWHVINLNRVDVQCVLVIITIYPECF